nr:MAG TPA: hypothetical protein [Caudoviricetes sp.]
MVEPVVPAVPVNELDTVPPCVALTVCSFPVKV